jgi:hypothetical protein
VKLVCVVCGREYEPNLEEGGRAALIYCSSQCAWGSTPRDVESMKREVEALRKMLDEKSS